MHSNLQSYDDDENRVNPSHQTWEGEPNIRGPTWLHSPLITLSLFGLQLVWSIEMAYASPYLISLGLSKSATALVFIAGPLSGLIMQPIIGAFADHSTNKFGRRRPYILASTLISSLSILLLGYTRHVSNIFTTVNSKANDNLTIILAVFAVYLIDFSINAVQAADRALIVDTLPSHKQENANAWATRMIGIGSCIGYFVGNIDLPRHLSFLGDTQLEILSSLTAVFMILTHLLTSWAVSEKVLKSDGNRQSILNIFKNLFTAKPPPKVKQLCLIQFFASMGWFPIMFWSTSYIGELYLDDRSLDQVDDHIVDEATRIGTRAMLFQAITSLSTAIIMPYLIQPLIKINEIDNENKLLKFVKKFIPSSLLDLSSLWTFSHLLFAISIFSTIFTSNYKISTAFIAMVGFTWAFAMWAPFSLVGESILLDSKENDDVNYIPINNSNIVENEVLFNNNVNDYEYDESHQQPRFPPTISSTSSTLNEHQQQQPLPKTAASQAGVMLGILNVSMVIPQFLITGIASVIFKLMEPSKHSGKRSASADFSNTNAKGIGIVMRIGACAAFIAAILSYRFTKERLSLRRN